MLCDYNMPGFDARRALMAPHSGRDPDLVVGGERLVAGYDLGTNSYIRKPVSFEQFSDVVRHLGLYWLVINEPPPV